MRSLSNMLRTLYAVLAVFVLLAGACGGDQPRPSQPSEAGSDAAAADIDRTDTNTDVFDAFDGDVPAADAGLDITTSDTNPDSGPAIDATDAALTDPTDATDAPSTAVPLAGFGTISGECGVLDDELTATQPSYVENHIDFANDPYDEVDSAKLTDGGREIIADGNAGGNSLLSEVFAYEVLHRCELADLLETETEITYQDPQGKITDLLVEADGLKIGVSVTRAIAWPFDDPYTVAQAKSLLEDKLNDVQASSANVAPSDAWTKQILHVVAYTQQHEDSVETAWGQLDAEVRADTVVVVTVTDGQDGFLY